jgi:hypothetical protein
MDKPENPRARFGLWRFVELGGEILLSAVACLFRVGVETKGDDDEDEAKPGAC